MQDPEVEFGAAAPGAEQHEELVRRAALHVLAREGRPGTLSISLVDDARMRDVHRDAFGAEETTDVIAFPLADAGDPDPLLGDVVVSLETAAREAAARGLPLSEELRRYVIHGVLHVLGYRDDTGEERAAMWERQEALLRELAEPEG